MSSSTSPPIASSEVPQAGEPAWDIALLYPLQGSWTEDDYLGLSTNRLVEFSDGCIEVLPMPSKFHQRLVRALFLLLQQFVAERKLGEVFFAPLPVHLWLGKFREPDIVFVRPERSEYRGQPEGADLVIEVVSEGAPNRRRDIETKPADYARARIPEYWIVDPELSRITVLVLDGDGDKYREHGAFTIEDTATSVLLAGFAVSVRDLFADAAKA